MLFTVFSSGKDEETNTVNTAEFCGWEAHTRGIGSKLLLKMGYELGKGMMHQQNLSPASFYLVNYLARAPSSVVMLMLALHCVRRFGENVIGPRGARAGRGAPERPLVGPMC